MIFNLRPLNKDDYDNTLLGWWKDWGWEAPLKDFLPQNGTGGLMVLDGENPVCAGFIYMTNSKVALVEWVISNKNYRKNPERQEALELLIKSLTNICKDLGSNYTYALLKHKGLIETYEKVGYTQGDSYTKEMIKKL
ncbi:MAG: hypothetical protein GOVbin1678_72 [Prokaryotic dsDNA virus sp.]|jgi:hypothetical protein|nr:MAG: hypothetical protein GOVbin1678_72 [Prokaryotic dsDNA virus sp.]|tara:strand:- start:47376 stop:47786 length:411 start_codon:yes stop_codon:yes gene_type:complete